MEDSTIDHFWIEITGFLHEWPSEESATLIWNLYW